MSAAGGWSGPAGIAAIEAEGLAAALPAATTTGLLEHAARRVPDRPALIFLPNGRADDAPIVPTHAALLDAAAVFDERPAPTDLAACFHTGGTTGAPKPVRHGHANQAHAAWFMGLGYGLGPGDAVLNGFPLFHVAGAICHGLAELAHGASIVVPSQTGMRNRGFIGDHWRLVERVRISILTGGPTFLTTLLNLPLDGADISSARVLVTGGSPLPPPLADAFEARFGVPVRALLGMTEACGIVSLEPLAAARVPQGRGWPLPFSEQLRAAVERSLARGVFGSPFFLVGEEPFFGLEKMELLEEWLATGGW
jgi:acyl-coenzyme A synthetase/AMP-(fatty) acid ligase